MHWVRMALQFGLHQKQGHSMAFVNVSDQVDIIEEESSF